MGLIDDMLRRKPVEVLQNQSDKGDSQIFPDSHSSISTRKSASKAATRWHPKSAEKLDVYGKRRFAGFYITL